MEREAPSPGEDEAPCDFFHATQWVRERLAMFQQEETEA
jgi:hypothetical protein